MKFANKIPTKSSITPLKREERDTKKVSNHNNTSSLMQIPLYNTMELARTRGTIPMANQEGKDRTVVEDREYGHQHDTAIRRIEEIGKCPALKEDKEERIHQQRHKPVTSHKKLNFAY